MLGLIDCYVRLSFRAAGEKCNWSWPWGCHGCWIRQYLAFLAPAVLLQCWPWPPVPRTQLFAWPTLGFDYPASCWRVMAASSLCGNRGGSHALHWLQPRQVIPPSLLCGHGHISRVGRLQIWHRVAYVFVFWPSCRWCTGLGLCDGARRFIWLFLSLIDLDYYTTVLLFFMLKTWNFSIFH